MTLLRGCLPGAREGRGEQGPRAHGRGGQGPKAGRPRTSTPPPPPLTHLEPKSKPGWQPRPSLRLPSRLALWTDGHRRRAGPPPHRGLLQPLRLLGTESDQVGGRQLRGPRGGREQVYMMYWFTGYIFDTFDELTQMFPARKDSPSVTAAVLSISASRSGGRVQATGGDPSVRGAPQPPRPPSLPWAE